MRRPQLPSNWPDLSRVASRNARRSAVVAKTLESCMTPRGVAVVNKNGTIFGAPELSPQDGGGCSAERAALYRARMENSGRIVCILVRGGKSGRSDGGPPTAASLQVILELAPGAAIFWGTDRTPRGGQIAKELLPGAFEKGHLSST